MVVKTNDDLIYDHLVECLRLATQNIKHSYMFLPIAGSVLPIYRERVYCYELYHQFRIVWNDHKGFSINGEVDKTHHPLIHDPNIKNSKPDFLIHKPGNMSGNLAIIEVKPVTARKDDIKKDLITMTAFLKIINYHFAIYLVYGDDINALDSFILKAISLQEMDANNEINLDSIMLFWHQSPGKTALRIPWVVV